MAQDGKPGHSNPHRSGLTDLACISRARTNAGTGGASKRPV